MLRLVRFGAVKNAAVAVVHKSHECKMLARGFRVSACVRAEDSHSDFKPIMKASPTDPANLKAQVDELVKKNKVVLFMKGTPVQPMCGFSAKTVRFLQMLGSEVHGVDILSNPVLRQYMKEYSQWPTFPQLYINGEFVGGCDIATQMYESGELEKALQSAGAIQMK